MSTTTTAINQAQIGSHVTGFSPGTWVVILHLIALLSDLVSVSVAMAIANIVRYETTQIRSEHILPFALSLILSSALLCALFRPTKQISLLSSSCRQGLIVWTLTLVGVVLILFLLKTTEEVSRVWLVFWYLSGIVTICLSRILLKLVVEHTGLSGALRRRALFVAEKETLDTSAARRLPLAHWRDVETVIEVDGMTTSLQRHGCELDENLMLQQIRDNVRTTIVTEIVLLLPWERATLVKKIVNELRHLPIEIYWRPQSHNPTSLSVVRLFQSGGVQTMLLLARPIDGWRQVYKRSLDLLLSLIILLSISPLLLACTFLVFLSSNGPILYQQRRVGFNGQIINVFKFRTMFVQHCDRAASMEVRQAKRNDPRVTPIGRFLRRTSVDELPQFFNVLRGEMSIVGPRPHAIAHDGIFRTQLDDYLSRYRVKPGITGWAQVNGYRGETDTVEKLRRRIEHDLYYIEHWSPFLDIHILVRTVYVCLLKNDAY